MSTKPHWQGEVQFRRYSDTSTQGQQVVFAVDGRDELEPFIGMEGRRFMAVFVEIGDDEQPVQRERKDERGPLCKEAVDLARNPAFQRFVLEVTPVAFVICSERDCREYILAETGIADKYGADASRKHLDSDAEAAHWFVERIRKPFMAWQRNNQPRLIEAVRGVGRACL